MFRPFLKIAGAAALSLVSLAPAQAETISGAYLAGRHAAVRSDFSAASQYYSAALARDTDNTELMESAALSLLSLGQIDKALPIARVLESKKASAQIADIIITASLAKQGDFDALIKHQSDESGLGKWVAGLVKAWAHVGMGDVSTALEKFDQLAKERGIQGIVMYHKALALASVGDFEGAETIFDTGAAGGIGNTRRGVLAHAEILAKLGKHDKAITLIESSFAGSTDPELDAVLEALKNKQDASFSNVSTAIDGIAEVYFTFAAVLKSENAGDHYILLYSRVARYLRSDHIDALLLTANLLEGMDQYDLALQEYKAIQPDNPSYHVAELGRAAILMRTDREDQAIEVLEQLSKTHGDLASVYSTLGDVLMAQDKYAEATTAYDRAIELISEENKGRWALLYSRGIAYEQSGNWEASEADFRAALELNPENPKVLNYLGYSMVEQKRNLDEALDMIERAVAGEPTSGYIVDSLGWVLYRLGRYDDAVVQMERAVELLAIDPVLNDHLGDVYWAVGREREARFQWRRALSFVKHGQTSDEVDPDRIRRKLEVGLDKVLSEEGAPPLKVANDE